MKNPKIKTGESKTPEVLPPIPASPRPVFAMDGTSHVEISLMQNEYYSKEIIKKTKAAFSIKKLREKISDDNTEFLAEGEYQIHHLWHGIEALTVHNTMFVVLFLLAIGEVLDTVREQLPNRNDFVRWRRRVFHPKQERYLQQAQQLASMGDFARKYASMGKKRLLILDNLKKEENKETYESLFESNPIPEEIKEQLPSDEELKEHPIPDSSDDFDGTLLKEHVDALITYHRLKKAGIAFVTFDQAFLIASYGKNAIPVKKAEKIASWLNRKRTTPTKKRWFDILIMNKMVNPEQLSRTTGQKESLNYVLINFLEYCKDLNFSDQEWLSRQKELIDEEFVRQSNKYLKKIARAFEISLSTSR